MTGVLTDGPASTRSPARFVAFGGAAAVLLTVVMVGSLDLHRLTTTAVGLRRTISEYALGPYRWVFDTAVVLLAAGSLAILAVLVRKGITRWASGGSLAFIAWSVGLTLVVVFPKHDWSVGPSMSGSIHRVASLVAFISLPIAALLLARPWLRDAVWGAHARRTFRFGLLSALSFTPILYAVLVNVLVGTSWWRVLPLGYIERLLVLVEVVSVLVVAVWAIAAAQPSYRRSNTSR
ncbi:putative membrane protein [Saccharothrix tamanrassetensis]|uniref:Putative membrane protein n=1 Tax=Saccharothrix tamanrassetensis TaxID=1051531 RepID=A0A841CSP0_9PSEU|nr:putative membrane protein [Saccharothrix tamanrassetensis]